MFHYGAFIPELSLISVSRLSDSLFIKDITPVYNPSTAPYGFGVPGGPGSSSDIVQANILLSNLPYNKDIQNYATNYSGSLFPPTSSLYSTISMYEGVSTIYAYYPQLINNTFTLSTDKLTLTFSGFSTTDLFSQYFDGVYGVGNKNVFGNYYKIVSKNISNFSITLSTPFIEIQTVQLLKYYIGTLYILILNRGKSNLCNDIGNMAISNQMCNIDIINNLTTYDLLLKASKIFFTNQEYSKAHNAAILVANRISIFQNFNDNPIINNQISAI